MDPQQLVDLIMQKKWVPLAIVFIGLIVRLLKSDTKIPIDIPPRLRAPLAICLGAAAGAIDKLVQQGDVTWTTALVSGLSAAAVAMVMHSLVIESARGGKEIVIPGLIKKNTPPGPGKPPSIPPTAGNEQTMQDIKDGKPVDTAGLVRSIYRGAMPVFKETFALSMFVLPPVVTRSFTLRKLGVPMLFAGALALFLNACALFTPANLPKTAIDTKDILCIIEHAFLDDAALNTVCDLLTPAQQQAAHAIAEAHRAQLDKEMRGMREEVCSLDAGAPCSGAGCATTHARTDGGTK